MLVVVIGTRSVPQVETRRRWMAADWLVRKHAPAWMLLTDALMPHAEALRGLPEVTESSIARATPTITEALEAATAARRASRGTGRDILNWCAAGDRAGVAAKDAGCQAALAAAIEHGAVKTAWAGTQAAAHTAAWAAAKDAADQASKAAAWAAANGARLPEPWAGAVAATRADLNGLAMREATDEDRAGTGAAALSDASWVATWAATWTTGGAALAPTTARLQDSAVRLVRRMAAVKA
jgi:hypothetical protein